MGSIGKEAYERCPTGHMHVVDTLMATVILNICDKETQEDIHKAMKKCTDYDAHKSGHWTTDGHGKPVELVQPTLKIITDVMDERERKKNTTTSVEKGKRSATPTCREACLYSADNHPPGEVCLYAQGSKPRSPSSGRGRVACCPVHK